MNPRREAFDGREGDTAGSDLAARRPLRAHAAEGARSAAGDGPTQRVIRAGGKVGQQGRRDRIGTPGEASRSSMAAVRQTPQAGILGGPGPRPAAWPGGVPRAWEAATSVTPPSGSTNDATIIGRGGGPGGQRQAPARGRQGPTVGVRIGCQDGTPRPCPAASSSMAPWPAIASSGRQAKFSTQFATFHLRGMSAHPSGSAAPQRNSFNGREILCATFSSRSSGAALPVGSSRDAPGRP